MNPDKMDDETLLIAAIEAGYCLTLAPRSGLLKARKNALGFEINARGLRYRLRIMELDIQEQYDATEEIN